MGLITIFILAVGLGVDAFSVAIGIGATNDKKSCDSGTAAGGGLRTVSVCHAHCRLAGRPDGCRNHSVI
jgi:putative Mn2+ efflux pump MntP